MEPINNTQQSIPQGFGMAWDKIMTVTQLVTNLYDLPEK
jgi:hypothetical protein